jgi:cyclase
MGFAENRMLRLQMLIVGLLLVTSTARGQPGSVRQIVPGVWFREGDLKGQQHCNNIFIEMKDYIIVVDANYPSGAIAAMADIKKLSRKPVKYVFITHNHGDHLYGAAVWTRAGAVTLGFKGVIDDMNHYEPQRWENSYRQRQDIRDLGSITPEPPRKSLDKSPYVLTDGRRRVEFHTFGWAHTRGDGFVYLPKEGVLCTGDVVTSMPNNYTGDGHITNWASVIRAASKLPATHILPGHGSPGGRELLKGEEQFFLELTKAVKAAVDQKKRLTDIVTISNRYLVATSIQLPPAVKNWVGDDLPNQVKDTYEEISSGKPHGELLGGK